MPASNDSYRIQVTPELIEKYLQGQLDAKTMHAMERQALDDPFLYEALEGFALRAPEQSTHLEDLHQRLSARLQTRKPGKRKLMVLRYRNAQIAAAAILLLLIGVGVFFFAPERQVQKNDLAVKERTKILPQDTGLPASGIVSTLPKDTHAGKDVAVHLPAKKTPSPVADKARLPGEKRLAAQEPVKSTADTIDVLAYNIQQRESVAGSVNTIQSPALMAARAPAGARVYSKGLAGKSAGISKDTILITGKVSDANSKEPLNGVTVTIPGTREGTVTDSSGRFQLNLAKPPEQLAVKYIGYHTQRLTPNTRLQPLEIELQPTSEALSEVVVTGYGNVGKKALEKRNAVPAGGLDAFHRYIKAHVQYPVDSGVNPFKAKKVVLSFLVLPDSTLKDIKIVKSPGEGFSREAIRLLKAGPAWYPLHQEDSAHQEIEINFPRNNAGK